MPLLALFLALAAAAPADDRELYERACDRVAAAYDSARGGFVARTGVPSESAVELALIRGREPGSARWKEQALATIAWTRGLRDTIGGGFVLSAAEADPHHAHVYKPADVNARRLENLIQAWRLTSEPEYRQDAARVADFFDRVLLDGRGGFIPGQASGFDLVPEANGLAIHAWLEWAAATTDRARRDFSLMSLDRVWDTCWVPDLGLLRRGSFGEVLKPPQLVDQVEMGRAFMLAARLAGRRADADRARTLGDLLLARFEHQAEGGFLTQWAPARKGKIKRAARVPAENARAALFLCELTTLTGESKYREAARRAWRELEEKLDKPRLDAAGWALAIHAAIEPALPDAPQWPRIDESPAPPRWRSMTFKTRAR
ncbi:MAG: hypothetical protein AAB113_04035 [Candidatus Eisenbacteria bacterium]